MTEQIIQVIVSVIGPIVIGIVVVFQIRAKGAAQSEIKKLEIENENLKLKQQQETNDAARENSLIRLIEKQTDNISEISSALKGVRKASLKLGRSADDLQGIIKKEVLSAVNTMNDLMQQIKNMQDDQNDRLSQTMDFFIRASKSFEETLNYLKDNDNKTKDTLEKLLNEIELLRALPEALKATAAQSATQAIAAFEARILKSLEKLEAKGKEQ